MKKKLIFILIGIGIFLSIGIALYFYGDKMGINILSSSSNLLSGITSQAIITSYFEDCSNISEWTIVPVKSWNSNAGRCINSRGTGGAAGNMSVDGINLNGYTQANLTFFANWSLQISVPSPQMNIYISNDSTTWVLFFSKEGIGTESFNYDITNNITFTSNMSLKAQRTAGGVNDFAYWDNINITGDDGNCISSNDGQDPLTTTLFCANSCRQTTSIDGSGGTIIISNASGIGNITLTNNISNYMEMQINAECQLNITAGNQI